MTEEGIQAIERWLSAERELLAANDAWRADSSPETRTRALSALARSNTAQFLALPHILRAWPPKRPDSQARRIDPSPPTSDEGDDQGSPGSGL